MNTYMSYLDQVLALSNGNKFSGWYAALMKKALGRKLQGYKERHHILPKCFKMGGDKDPNNIIELTAREHFIAHQLMARMFSSTRHSNQMLHALRMISQTKNRYHLERVTSRTHTRLGAPQHTHESREKMRASHLALALNPVTVLGKTFNSHGAARRHFGLTPTQLGYLLADPTEERLQHLRAVPLVEGFDNAIPTAHEGIIYASIRQAALAAGVSYTKFRIMKGL